MASKKTENTQENTESTAIVKDIDHEDKINEAALELKALADSKDEATGIKILELAKLTQPTVKGIEGQNRIIIPKVLLRQASSTNDMMPDSCKLGQLYDSDGTNIGDELTMIPILRHALRMKWEESSSNIDCMSLDGENGSRYGKCKECPHGRFEPNVRPVCSPGHRFYVVTEDLTRLYQIDFLKSSAKAGKNIMKLARPPALWAKSYKLSVEKHSNNNRNYFTLKTQPTGDRVDPGTMEVCEALHKFFHAMYQRGLDMQSQYSQQLTGGDSSIDVSGGDVLVSDDEGSDIDLSDSM